MTTVRWGVLSTAKIGREKVIPGIQAASVVVIEQLVAAASG